MVVALVLAVVVVCTLLVCTDGDVVVVDVKTGTMVAALVGTAFDVDEMGIDVLDEEALDEAAVEPVASVVVGEGGKGTVGGRVEPIGSPSRLGSPPAEAGAGKGGGVTGVPVGEVVAAPVPSERVTPVDNPVGLAVPFTNSAARSTASAICSGVSRVTD